MKSIDQHSLRLSGTVSGSGLSRFSLFSALFACSATVHSKFGTPFVVEAEAFYVAQVQKAQAKPQLR
jgi:hypothetical protein